MAVPASTAKALATLTLPAGTYVVTAGNEWAINSTVGTVSYLVVDGVSERIERGTMAGGGGSSMAAVLQKDKEFTVSLYGYWGSGSGSVNAQKIRLDAVRIK